MICTLIFNTHLPRWRRVIVKLTLLLRHEFIHQLTTEILWISSFVWTRYRVNHQYTDKPVFGQLLLWNYTCYRTLGYTKIYIISVTICVPKTVTFASWLRPLQCFTYKCPTTAAFRQTYHNSAAKWQSDKQRVRHLTSARQYSSTLSLSTFSINSFVIVTEELVSSKEVWNHLTGHTYMIIQRHQSVNCRKKMVYTDC